MNSKDLMVGDWLLYKGNPIKIIGTDGSQNIIYYYNEEDYTEYPIDASKIEPILLTEEILHNNGFKNDVIAQKSIIAEGASNFSVILFSEDNRIKLDNIDEYLNSFNKWSVHIDTEDMRTMCTAEITYVHELQHLLKLCKIEKEIIL